MVEKYLIYADIIGGAFAGVSLILHIAGLDKTKWGKAVTSVSVDIAGAVKALRKPTARRDSDGL